MLIQGGLVYTNGAFVKRDIEIEGGVIRSLGTGLEGNDVFDARGFVIVPGFVNAHTHLSMSLLRGAGDDMPLHSWLNDRIWPLEASLSYDDCYWGSLFGIVEMLKTGTTCFNDMYFHMDATTRAVRETGIRAAITHAVIDLGDEKKAQTELQESSRIHRMCRDEKRISYMMGPHAPYTCSEAFLLQIKEYARAHGIKTHIHLSETRKEVEDMEQERSVTPVGYLDSLSFLDEDTICAHGVHLTPEDIKLISSRGCSIVHCPQSNLKLSSGIAPLPQLLDAPIDIALGTDGAASNNSLNMIQETKCMALIHKLQGATEVPASTAFSIATRGGGKALGLPVGELTPGYNADMVFIDASHFSMRPSHSLISNLVYSLQEEAIRHVMVDGTFVLRDRELTMVDETSIIEKACEHANALVELIE
ncbi:amidohydrolase [archaeon]|nr:MAG: amidohydrolase [archaeon]